MNKALKKAQMKRTRLRNPYLKKKTVGNKIAYKMQRSYCVSLLQKTKRNYYVNLNEKNVADNKQFWRTNKPVLSGKVKSAEKIILVEVDKIVNEDRRNATVLNNFFSNAVENLKIPEYHGADTRADDISHPVLKAIFKYRNHPSIDPIKSVKIR